MKHRGAVGIGYKPENNCGCIVAMLVIAPLAIIWLLGNSLGGFGCEGAGEPCTPRYGRFLLGAVALIGLGLALAWLINAVRRRLLGERH